MRANNVHLLTMGSKDQFIRQMVANVLKKRYEDVNERQFKAGKVLFLATAYNADPKVLLELEEAVRAV